MEVSLIGLKASRIVRAMKRFPIFLVLLVSGALPLFAQSTEFGFVAGASRRFVDNADPAEGTELLDSELSLSNNSFELFWGVRTEEDVFLKVKLGRIETPIAFEEKVGEERLRRDLEGEVQHASAVIEYRFSEPYGSTALFGGLGIYRQTAEGADARHDFGWNAGLNADFPISRRYGFLVETTYHWARGDFRARYWTIGAGLRLSL